ncbi:MAG: enoyl-CoA hydratase-related protein [Candidatus Krumholzibacteria bacterium]|nr:enoyl-CoA hydratase-related protein [Candidatus Krumholzibacteria bacterium]MDP7021709.1 enoyl-CoA hydratase-related protein [Candidatus Krumholzibacteria bacterium]
MSWSNLTLEFEGPVARLEIFRPKALNALNFETLNELDRALDEIRSRESCSLLFLRGEGAKSFVAGADITELAKLDREQGVEVARRGQALFDRIELLPFPVIALVNGFALGGGCELALACDLRIASENAVFGLPEVKLGVIPGYGGTQRLSRLLGSGRALEMIFTGRMVPAPEALSMGLVNRVVPADSLEKAGKEMAEQILANSPRAIAAAKESVLEGQQEKMGEALEIEARLFGNLCGGEEMQEGMAAFLEKRRPDFPGS